MMQEQIHRVALRVHFSNCVYKSIQEKALMMTKVVLHRIFANINYTIVDIGVGVISGESLVMETFFPAYSTCSRNQSNPVAHIVSQKNYEKIYT